MRVRVLVSIAALTLLSGCSSILGISGPSFDVSGEWVVVRPGYSAFEWVLFEKDGRFRGHLAETQSKVQEAVYM
ncbi:hypothetical protein D3C86_1780640 [compost metagenome]